MSLLTRCPRCNTLFRVTPPQLDARGGKVRCGRCMNVFDAFQALTAENAAATSNEDSLGREALATPAPVSEVVMQRRPIAAYSAAAVAMTPDASQPGRASKSALAFTRARAWVDRMLAHPRWDFPALRSLSPSARWASAAAVAALLLLLQLGYAWRGELAARNDGIRSMLTSWCHFTGCRIPFPDSTDVVKIEASDVHMVDASQPQLVQLTATLRSYAGYYVAYPALDLVLTNANEHALARRVFVPQEYLDRSRDSTSGFAPRAEITIALDLDTGNLNAAGFRLDLLAAP